ncbi:hypothetical protein [Aquipseudomonas ullengensis]|uniref:Uncharacterized protein n=1 Tax=Aquipseudomonas ullengensis TaxID=2759166 RepID=A0A7W4LL01_9GAMM|nr:hypothetical protein [Pseudomonas ullengensis]MBB2495071.1 hypothetical protein [Pseudomonas ullengensis]
MSPSEQDLQQEQQLLQHFRQHSQGEPSAALDALILNAARQAVATPVAETRWSQRVHAWLFGPGNRTRWSAAFASLAIVGVGLSLTWRTQEQLPSTYDLPAPVAAQAPAAPMLREMAPRMANEAHKQSAEFEERKAEAVQKKMGAAESVAGAIDPDASYAAPAPAPAPSVARQMPLAKPAAPQVEALSDATADMVQPPSRTEAEAKAFAQAKAKAQAAADAKAKSQTAARATMQSQGNAEGQQFLSDEAPPLDVRLREVLKLREEGRQAQADQLLKTLQAEYPQQDLQAELKRLQTEVEQSGSSR